MKPRLCDNAYWQHLVWKEFAQPILHFFDVVVWYRIGLYLIPSSCTCRTCLRCLTFWHCSRRDGLPLHGLVDANVKEEIEGTELCRQRVDQGHRISFPCWLQTPNPNRSSSGISFCWRQQSWKKIKNTATQQWTSDGEILSLHGPSGCELHFADIKLIWILV